MPKISNPKSFLQTLIIIFIGAVIFILPDKIAISDRTSLPYSLFYKNKLPGPEIKKGSYIEFYMISPYIDNGEKRKLIKQVVCCPGELLIEINKDYFCGDQYLGKAKDKSLAGVPVENFKFTGWIPADSFFVMGQHKDSYDSRYFGFIRRDNVKAVVYPIF
jgi:conjugal transfer pilin signal peptidase TrbI